MPPIAVKIEGLSKLQSAIRRSPQTVIDEIGKFLARAGAKYRASILNSPWMVGATGGGSPVATGNLRDTHQTTIEKASLVIKPTAPYAEFVHEGTRRMKARPWLAFAVEQNTQEIDRLLQDMMNGIANQVVS
jgi:HK97 gp10 family phage protein